MLRPNNSNNGYNDIDNDNGNTSNSMITVLNMIMVKRYDDNSNINGNDY